MQNTFIFLFLTACVSRQVYERQLGEQKKQISQLQEITKEQEENYKNIVFRFRRTKASCRKQKENKAETEEQPTKTKMVCVVDEGEDICIEVVSVSVEND